MKKHIENILNRYVIAFVDGEYLGKKYNPDRYFKTDRITGAIKFENYDDANLVMNEYMKLFNNYELLIIPLVITYELVEEQYV